MLTIYIQFKCYESLKAIPYSFKRNMLPLFNLVYPR